MGNSDENIQRKPPGGGLTFGWTVQRWLREVFPKNGIFHEICHFRFRSFDNRFEVNWPPEPTLVLCWISKFFLFGALPSDTFKIKHPKI